MPIDFIKLTDFRNHENIEMFFNSGINVIWGENGSGKTSILEAVHILSIGKSFKTNRINETLKHNSNTSRIEGRFTKNKQTQSISFSQSSDKQRRLKIDNKPVKTIEIIGKNPVVLLSPEEQKITTGTPGDRRDYFNKLYSTVSKDYFSHLNIYTQILKQRNALLKHPLKHKDFNAWDDLLSKNAEIVWKKRKNYNTKFDQCLKKVSEMYDQKGVFISLETDNPTKSKKEILAELKKREERDLRYKSTSYGPHRDKNQFLYNNNPLKTYGSQGENKISLVLIKLAEYMFIQFETKDTPTLLLDDLFAKLDFDRSEAVLALLEKKSQTIITNTNLVDIEKHGIDLKEPNNKSFYLKR